VVYAGDIAEEGDIVQEPEWVELVAKIVKPELTVLGQSLDVQTQVKIAYGYEIRAYSYEKEPETEAIEFATDFIVVEDIDGGWKPRVVVEAKVGSVTTHDAITYSQKAANHRSVFPYLRYGIMLGNRQHYPLPGRLYRHGTQFDFMISFRGYNPSAKELEAFRNVLIAEVKASQALESMIYESRRRDRDHHTLLHRRLTLGDIHT
jgi:hypothetical protein